MKIEDLIRIEVPPFGLVQRFRAIIYVMIKKKWTTLQGEWEWKEIRGRGENVRREVAHVIDFMGKKIDENEQMVKKTKYTNKDRKMVVWDSKEITILPTSV